MQNELISLYVDDDPMSRHVVKLLFTRKLGYHNLTILEDSANFMEQVEALPQKPNLFLLDIHLKPDNGFVLLKKLRAHKAYQTAKIVAVTASVMVEEVEMLKEAGFDGALGKPIDPEDCEDFFKQVLAGKQVWRI